MCCAALLGDGSTMPGVISALKPPTDLQMRSRWLLSPSLPRTLQLASALLQHCEVSVRFGGRTTL